MTEYSSNYDDLKDFYFNTETILEINKIKESINSIFDLSWRNYIDYCINSKIEFIQVQSYNY